ncbi:RsmB/NOP family class I SAM-dependent RNA methyltransferase [Asticcacaulis sp. EMRT-3]|uniref:RsmB/NOP family class I SAM-dependent RNA methyltransferase n=1 Tax=Asticcacaulis sp. EMRT-3 TaxID=3040349 RepID=UPI0024AF096D|nr:RsmB/NOP family class I SAM-dependent RNA methyltransferase [Asticcacaulis sp. EMRT-3]MDI7775848.1 RsmB/NOP family class I SAM-dependent RNA methyltransferase [Asticcacaulis sp. EMRT-3]
MASPPVKSGKPTFQRKLARQKAVNKAVMAARKPARPVDAPTPYVDDGGDIGLKARTAALDLVKAALEKRSGFDEAVTRSEFLALSDSERGFARALALLMLRRLGQLDHIIAKKTKKLPNHEVIDLLRLGLAQIGFMQVPDFAAVSTTVKLADRSTATRPFKGLINAILRGVVREGGLPAPVVSKLAPDWLFQRWKMTYGEADAEAMAMVLTGEPATDLSFKTPAALSELAPALEGETLGPLTLRSALRGDVRDWAGYGEGVWWVQDAAASVPVSLLGDLSGKTAIDLCAAPGGKTLQLLASGASVVALDRSKNRLKRVEENLARIGYIAELAMADAEGFEDARQFDVVLLDAPCSATGTYRRQPDVLWGTRPSDIAKLADVQHRLLDSAARRVAPGGDLIYCTCSLEREEGETQVLAFLRRNQAFELVKIAPDLAESLGVPSASLRPEGWLRLLPHQRDGGQDGFFVALLKRCA